MTSDPQWHVNVEITPENASAFRLDKRVAARLSRAVWVGGVLSLRQAGRLHLVTGKDDRLGVLSLVVSARSSVSDGIAGGTRYWFHREVQLWRRSKMIRLIMFKPRARELFTAIGYRE
jgi:hypothetical protein